MSEMVPNLFHRDEHDKWPRYRQVTVSDLVEVLRDHGDVLMADELERHPGLANLRVPPGRYLVVPFGEDA